MLSFFQRPPSVEFQVDGKTVSLSLPKARNTKSQSTESTGQHIRKVTPGDHRDKLDQATIDTLNSAFEAVLRRYDYA